MKFIKLDEKSYFKVISKETNRIVTVIGMYISNENKVTRYEIKGEGDWSVSRFKKMESSISEDEFYVLQDRVDTLEDALHRIICFLK